MTAISLIKRPNSISRLEVSRNYLAIALSVFVLATGAIPVASWAEGLDHENFDSDPDWDAHNNQLSPPAPRTATQDFGYRTSNHAGSAAGEIGGIVDRSPLDPAWYAQVTTPLTFDDLLSFSGQISLLSASATSGFTSASNIFIGFFNSEEQGWRPPNWLGFQVQGFNEPVPNVATLELSYGTSAWEADGTIWGQTVFPNGAQHSFNLTYDPNNGSGRITLAWNGTEIIALGVRSEHRASGATFNRFGIFNMELPGVPEGNTTEVYFDDLTVNGALHDFATDPGWEGVGNQTTFSDSNLYGINNFGYRTTSFAGGSPGELGGLAWRVEDSDEQFQAYYAKDIGILGLSNHLIASGKIAFEKFSTDAGVMLGWFDSSEQDWPPRISWVCTWIASATPVVSSRRCMEPARAAPISPPTRGCC